MHVTGGSEPIQEEQAADTCAAPPTGQDQAVNAVADAVLRSRAGLASQSRGSSFLFLGPTGVGKTELAKALAELLFDDEKNMVRQPCLKHTVPHAQSARVGRAHGRTVLGLCNARSLHDVG